MTVWKELINKQPDIFSDRSFAVIVQILSHSSDVDLVCGALCVVKHAALLHEINRQNIINAGVVKHLVPLIHKDEKVFDHLVPIFFLFSTYFCMQILKDTCSVFRHLILDDDIRIEFSKAHDHARLIAAEVLTDLTQLMTGMQKHNHIKSKLLLSRCFFQYMHEMPTFCQNSY